MHEPTQMQGYISLSIEFAYEDDQWIAICPELGLAMQDDHLAQCQKDLEEAIDLFLQSLDEEGDRDEFFKEHGIVLHRIDREDESTMRLPSVSTLWTLPA